MFDKHEVGLEYIEEMTPRAHHSCEMRCVSRATRGKNIGVRSDIAPQWRDALGDRRGEPPQPQRCQVSMRLRHVSYSERDVVTERPQPLRDRQQVPKMPEILAKLPGDDDTAHVPLSLYIRPPDAAHLSANARPSSNRGFTRKTAEQAQAINLSTMNNASPS
ncbi:MULTISPECIES: hypothetical protein [Pandoraea]|uniref:hypothetical protein n=1 Tax=Pandoraea TaxID=93217 RepID=UPI001314DAF4|nr:MULTISPECIES: hypothetical protein [Pandoraea]